MVRSLEPPRVASVHVEDDLAQVSELLRLAHSLTVVALGSCLLAEQLEILVHVHLLQLVVAAEVVTEQLCVVLVYLHRRRGDHVLEKLPVEACLLLDAVENTLVLLQLLLDIALAPILLILLQHHSPSAERRVHLPQNPGLHGQPENVIDLYFFD